jgi:hypothetical protein
MDRFSEGLNTASIVAEAFRWRLKAHLKPCKQKREPAEFR